jgi:hypothetical protein
MMQFVIMIKPPLPDHAAESGLTAAGAAGPARLDMINLLVHGGPLLERVGLWAGGSAGLGWCKLSKETAGSGSWLWYGS